MVELCGRDTRGGDDNVEEMPGVKCNLSINHVCDVINGELVSISNALGKSMFLLLSVESSTYRVTCNYLLY